MTFEFDGEKYKKASAHQKEWGAKLIGDIALQGTERILDLGCGDGAMTAQLARLVPDGLVVGIDASLGMIQAAERAYQEKNLRFERLDINAISFHEEFDLVISNATLHWLLDHERLLANVHTALKAGGTARFNFAADGNCSFFFKVVRLAMELPEFAGFFETFVWPWYMPDLEAYKRLAAGAAFAEISVWGENADRYFPDQEAMIKWIDQPSIVPFLGVIPERDRQAFRDWVVERMIFETRQPDGTCFETFRRVNLRARKGSQTN